MTFHEALSAGPAGAFERSPAGLRESREKAPESQGVCLWTGLWTESGTLFATVISAIPISVKRLRNYSEGRGRPAGADGYLVKPYSFQRLMNTLEEHLDHPEH